LKSLYLIPAFALVAVLFHFANAQVYVPEDQYAGYFDSNGIYSVYGSVRNNESQPIIAEIQVTINSGDHALSESRILPVILPTKDMPFKFKFPQITDSDPILQKPKISFILTNTKPLNVDINYDRTLVRYPDGHLTGFITNSGNETVYNINVYALVHNKINQFIDEVESTQTIPKINHGDKAEFIMFPDPIVTKQVTYYSCFIPGTDNFIQMSTHWRQKAFYFSVLSIVYFTNQKFDVNQNAISFDASNPWQIPYFANFMFPSGSSRGDFKVFIDGKQINSLISKENNTGNWHVAFNVDYGQHKVMISGFDSNYVPSSNEYFFLTPKSALTAWAGYSTYTIPDSQLLDVLGINGEFVPPWLKGNVKYMIFNDLPTDEIVNEIKYLKQAGIVR
jgi:hypothetical protein